MLWNDKEMFQRAKNTLRAIRTKGLFKGSRKEEMIHQINDTSGLQETMPVGPELKRLRRCFPHGGVSFRSNIVY